MYFYQDRQDAGSELAQLLMSADIKDPLMLALLPGGVPVASVISHETGLPFDVIVTRKVGHPASKELVIGAMTEDERAFITEEINYADPRILEAINEERQELRKKIALFRQGRQLPDVARRNVILVDDGLSDGVSALTAAKFLKERGALKVVLAVPVATAQNQSVLTRFIDSIICPHELREPGPVYDFYQDFSEVSDKDIVELLGRGGAGGSEEYSLAP